MCVGEEPIGVSGKEDPGSGDDDPRSGGIAVGSRGRRRSNWSGEVVEGVARLVEADDDVFSIGVLDVADHLLPRNFLVFLS